MNRVFWVIVFFALVLSVIVFTDKQVTESEETTMEWRCVQEEVYVSGSVMFIPLAAETTKYWTKIGDRKTCGYGLVQSGIAGGNSFSWDMSPIGEKE